MKIQLVFQDRTGGDTVIVKSQHTFEKITNTRVEQMYGAPTIVQRKTESNMVHVGPDGLSEEIELTRKNALFISKMVGEGCFFKYVDESQEIFVQQLLSAPAANSVPDVRDERKAAPPRRGRPSKTVAEPEPEAAGSVFEV